MLGIYRKEFNEIMETTKGKRRTLLLSNLMSQMEDFYKLSMLKERFERETDPDVKELYLAVAAARKF